MSDGDGLFYRLTADDPRAQVTDVRSVPGGFSWPEGDEGNAVGHMLHAILNPAPLPGPPWTHTLTSPESPEPASRWRHTAWRYARRMLEDVRRGLIGGLRDLRYRLDLF